MKKDAHKSDKVFVLPIKIYLCACFLQENRVLPAMNEKRWDIEHFWRTPILTSKNEKKKKAEKND